MRDEAITIALLMDEEKRCVLRPATPPCSFTRRCADKEKGRVFPTFVYAININVYFLGQLHIIRILLTVGLAHFN